VVIAPIVNTIASRVRAQKKKSQNIVNEAEIKNKQAPLEPIRATRAHTEEKKAIDGILGR